MTVDELFAALSENDPDFEQGVKDARKELSDDLVLSHLILLERVE